MKYSTVKKAFLLFTNDNADKALIRANVKRWLAAMMYLGDKHILAIPVQRKTKYH